jgi:hypothetical protein
MNREKLNVQSETQFRLSRLAKFSPGLACRHRVIRPYCNVRDRRVCSVAAETKKPPEGDFAKDL